jgi:hypothetical protein
MSVEGELTFVKFLFEVFKRTGARGVCSSGMTEIHKGKGGKLGVRVGVGVGAG